MIVIDAQSAGEAWKKAINLVLGEGGEAHDGPTLIKECLDVYIEVADATKRDKIVELHGDKKMLSWMIEENFQGKKPVLDWNYSYGMRLRDFRGVDQMQKLIDRLRKNPEAKSATLVLMDPTNDYEGHMPCVVAIDFKLRDDRVSMTAYLRSQDIAKKCYADILALGSVQEQLCLALGKKAGPVKMLISSAHIYETDFDRAKMVIG